MHGGCVGVGESVSPSVVVISAQLACSVFGEECGQVVTMAGDGTT